MNKKHANYKQVKIVFRNFCLFRNPATSFFGISN